jgi:hypothetical protein
MLHKEDSNNPTDAARPKDDTAVHGTLPPNALDPASSEEDTEPQWTRFLTKTQAEDLLDWLEAHGVAGELRYEDGLGFAVRPVPKEDAAGGKNRNIEP